MPCEVRGPFSAQHRLPNLRYDVCLLIYSVLAPTAGPRRFHTTVRQRILDPYTVAEAAAGSCSTIISTGERTHRICAGNSRWIPRQGTGAGASNGHRGTSRTQCGSHACYYWHCVRACVCDSVSPLTECVQVVIVRAEEQCALRADGWRREAAVRSEVEQLSAACAIQCVQCVV